MTRRPVPLALCLALVGVVACAVSAVGLLRPEPVPRAVVRPVAAEVAVQPAEAPAAQVLREWDAARAAAWAAGDLDALAALYVPGASAGRRDVAMLRAWVERDLVVTGMSTQLLAVRELRRTPDRWRLEVTDRLAGAVAVGGGVEQPLPSDAATTRQVELRMRDGTWLVASVRTL
ncbi:hypothetical protein [Nocardioides flavescens]|uniref:SnoaL-like domain-containing protein n=1 Tax=Nocardioides flavescens TaxID=2691959 RepID=A0A6L7EXK1_9ACTN|nr:hypothetical protein [Nocardioides flavescens]MXG90596.1 hypothetical protein [Nocardioides flavescens]